MLLFHKLIFYLNDLLPILLPSFHYLFTIVYFQEGNCFLDLVFEVSVHTYWIVLKIYFGQVREGGE